MNNKKVLWVVLALLVLAIILYFLLGRGGDDTASNQVGGTSQSGQSATPVGSSNTTNNTTNATTSSSSLADLMASGKPVKCTFNEGGNQGTFIVSQGKSRGDFSTTVDGKTTQAHMIMDGQTSYFWVDGQNQGFKTTVTANSPTNENGISANQKMNFSCSDFKVSSSTFSLPSDVNFLGSTFQLNQ